MSDLPSRPPTEAEFASADALTRSQRHKRLPASVSRVRGLRDLHLRLADNAGLYEEGGLQDQRDAVADTLIAMQEFLQAQGFAPCTLAPIMRPVEALVEREHNRLDPLFAERMGSGRPKASLRDHQRTGILAALSKAWLKAHFDDKRPQAEKLAEAARFFKGKWFGKITKAELKTARDFVSQEASDHPAVVSVRPEPSGEAPIADIAWPGLMGRKVMPKAVRSATTSTA